MKKLILKYNVVMEYGGVVEENISIEEAVAMLEDKKIVEEIKQEIVKDLTVGSNAVIKVKNFKWEVIE